MIGFMSYCYYSFALKVKVVGVGLVGRGWGL